MFEITFKLNCSFFLSYRLCTINAQTNFFLFYQHIFTAKTLLTTFAKVFFVFIFCLVKHKSVKIFDVHIMRFITINYKQQVHPIFKFFLKSVCFHNKYINANVFSFFNLAKKIFWNKKPNPTIIKIINKLFIFSRNSFWMYYYWLNMSDKTP